MKTSSSPATKKPDYWTIIKWSIMASGIFWMLVFRLSEIGVKLPEFVYVNF